MSKSDLKLSSYAPVRLTVTRKQVTKADVDKQIEQLASSIPDYAATEEPAKNGDKVVARISLVEAGEPMKGWDNLELPFRLGDGFVFDGVADGIVGMRPGETKDFEFEVPAVGGASDEDDPEMNKVEAHVELLEVNGASKAEITDEWVARNGGKANTVSELRAQLEKQLQDQNDQEFQNQARDYCSAVLGSRLVGQVPDEDIARSKKGVRSQFESMLVQQQMTEDQFMEQQGLDRDGLDRQFEQQAHQTAAIGIALELMAEHLGVEVTDEDLEAVFQQAGKKVPAKDALAGYLKDGGKRENIERIARCQKALDAVVAQAEAAA